MTISQIKQKLDFYNDALYQAGYDLGIESAVETIEQLSDSLWNNNKQSEAEALRKAVKMLRGEDA